VEQAPYVVLTDVLDLLDPNQGGISTFALDLLGESLEVLVALRRVGQEVGRAFERHRAERPQSPPHAHTKARRSGRDADQQQEKRRGVHVTMKQ
jgi:hypothetical protein